MFFLFSKLKLYEKFCLTENLSHVILVSTFITNYILYLYYCEFSSLKNSINFWFIEHCLLNYFLLDVKVQIFEKYIEKTLESKT